MIRQLTPNQMHDPGRGSFLRMVSAGNEKWKGQPVYHSGLITTTRDGTLILSPTSFKFIIV